MQSSELLLILLLTVFVLAIFVGVEVINKVPPLLHTPLMSGSNAISGITIIGAILSAGTRHTDLTTILGFLAVVLAMINVVGGFAVTDRMLGMFKENKRAQKPGSPTHKIGPTPNGQSAPAPAVAQAR